MSEQNEKPKAIPVAMPTIEAHKVEGVEIDTIEVGGYEFHLWVPKSNEAAAVFYGPRLHSYAERAWRIDAPARLEARERIKAAPTPATKMKVAEEIQAEMLALDPTVATERKAPQRKVDMTALTKSGKKSFTAEQVAEMLAAQGFKVVTQQ